MSWEVSKEYQHFRWCGGARVSDESITEMARKRRAHLLVDSRSLLPLPFSLLKLYSGLPIPSHLHLHSSTPNSEEEKPQVLSHTRDEVMKKNTTDHRSRSRPRRKLNRRISPSQSFLHSSAILSSRVRPKGSFWTFLTLTFHSFSPSAQDLCSNITVVSVL